MRGKNIRKREAYTSGGAAFFLFVMFRGVSWYFVNRGPLSQVNDPRNHTNELTKAHEPEGTHAPIKVWRDLLFAATILRSARAIQMESHL